MFKLYGNILIFKAPVVFFVDSIGMGLPPGTKTGIYNCVANLWERQANYQKWFAVKRKALGDNVFLAAHLSPTNNKKKNGGGLTLPVKNTVFWESYSSVFNPWASNWSLRL